ncbi:MAG: RsmB/NOP family class I SAM-dependent RNA methyltransferase [Paracoccaceae bacterium]
MTPQARVAAAIDVIDAIEEGQAAEQALTRWARQSRFAGSKDRAAVRDHVFAALRHWRSDAVRGGGQSGRARMIGRLRAEGIDPVTIFSGQGYGPDVLNDVELAAGAIAADGAEQLDVPEWLWARLVADLGMDGAALTARTWQDRAPVTLRVNAHRSTKAAAKTQLADEGIETEDNPRAPFALTIVEGARRLRNSSLFQNGLVELQDASSQAVVAALPAGETVLDYCAGGGGKALALAADGKRVTAHDANPDRMRDLPDRANRAGLNISCMSTHALSGTYDLVLCDAPCSGSGSWRRSPQGKWDLTQSKFDDLIALQRDILDQAMQFVAPGGALIYATCSVFNAENEEQVHAFAQRHPNWKINKQDRWAVDNLGDGFFCSSLDAS